MVVTYRSTLTRPPTPGRVKVIKSVDDILRAADKAAPELRRALLNALEAMRNQIPNLEALLEAGRIDDVIAAVNVSIPPEMIDPIRDSLANTAPAAARPEAAAFGIAFNDVNVHAVRWAEQHAAQQITAISGTTRRAVNDAITDAIRQGTNPRILAQHVENLVGLTPGHAKAVDRLFNSFDLDTQLEQALRVSGVKSRRLLRWRAETIARTETIRAANMGQQVVWDAALDGGLLEPGTAKEWLATGDDKTCPICAVLDGQTVEVNGDFGVTRQATRFTRDGAKFTVTETRAMRNPTTTRTPPAHPRCRCSIVLDIDTSEVESTIEAVGVTVI